MGFSRGNPDREGYILFRRVWNLLPVHGVVLTLLDTVMFLDQSPSFYLGRSLHVLGVQIDPDNILTHSIEGLEFRHGKHSI
jgi:hypothetical protein